MDTMKIDATSDLAKEDVREAIRTAHDIKQGLFMRYLSDDMIHYLKNNALKNLRKITEDSNPGYLRISEHSAVYVPNTFSDDILEDMVLVSSNFANEAFRWEVHDALTALGYVPEMPKHWAGLSVDRVFDDWKDKLDAAKVIGVVTGSDTEFLDKVLDEYADKTVIIPYVADFDTFMQVDAMATGNVFFPIGDSAIVKPNESFVAAREMVKRYKDDKPSDVKDKIEMLKTNLKSPRSPRDLEDISQFFDQVEQMHARIRHLDNYFWMNGAHQHYLDENDKQ